MLKLVYFSYLFSVITLIIFFQSWRFDFVNKLIYGLSILFNVISLCLLTFSAKKNLENRYLLILNIIINLCFIIGMSYLAIMYFLLLDA